MYKMQYYYCIFCIVYILFIYLCYNYITIIKIERRGVQLVYIITALFILLDMVTGLIKAFKEKEYTSTIMREGLYHKVGSVLCVGFGVLVDYAQSLVDIGISVPVAISVCAYIIIMEIGSITENVCKINPEIMPEKLKAYFQKLSK